jgi:hypothetical protein
METRSTIRRPEGHWFVAIDWNTAVIRAALDTWYEMYVHDEEPADATWTIFDVWRAKLCSRVAARWAALTELEEYLFPYRDDCVAYGWHTIQQMTASDKKSMREWLDAPEPEPTEAE